MEGFMTSPCTAPELFRILGYGFEINRPDRIRQRFATTFAHLFRVQGPCQITKIAF
jgi:hypothetical protein